MLKKFFVILSLIFLALATFFSVSFFIIKRDIKVSEVTIEKGDNIKNVYDKVNLEYDIFDKVFLKINPFYANLKPGTYEIKNNISKYEFLVNINMNNSKIIKLTIPEGFTQEKILERIEALKLSTKEEMLQALNSIDFPYYHEKDNYDGYLYPETYIFHSGASAKEVAKTILNEFKKKFPIDKIENKKEFYDLLKLASIVEGETSKLEEKSLVAGVFKKRLKINMLLQSDATLKYVTKRQALKKELLTSDSPYNSYKHKGLPPTPINSPTYETIIETKNANIGKYLYFFMDKKGNTYFSETHDEHLRKRRSVD